MQCNLVILADQNPGFLEGVRRMLEKVAESVLMVSDESSLMQAVKRTSPDLVIADLSLPVSGAGNIVRLVKKGHPNIRIIVLSMHDEQPVMTAVMDAGAEGFVLKRRAAVDLLPAIVAVCRGQNFVSPDIVTEAVLP
jgi:DNA-binding NarL/FixJ family response regulator